jgi:hypothetical protein
VSNVILARRHGGTADRAEGTRDGTSPGSSSITDHRYAGPHSENDPGNYGNCTICGLARSAHADQDDGFIPLSRTYRCPHCVNVGADPCPHGRADAIGLDGLNLGAPTR